MAGNHRNLKLGGGFWLMQLVDFTPKHYSRYLSRGWRGALGLMPMRAGGGDGMLRVISFKFL